MTEFCFKTYLPEAREATRNLLPLPNEEKSKLRGNIFGTLLKLGYAFLWQVIDIFVILIFSLKVLHIISVINVETYSKLF